MTQLLPSRVELNVGIAAGSVRRVFGETSLRMFPFALGGKAFGSTASPELVEGILDAFWNGGGNYIDTASVYASGGSETLIGEWMRSRRNRDQLIIGTRIGEGIDPAGLSSSAISRAIESSLVRLGTDRIDVLYLDLDDEVVPFEETLVALDENVRRGHIRHLGLSHHSANRLIEARIIAGQLGLTPITAVQCRYNLTHRSDFEGAIANVAAQQHLAVVPRFALDGGFLAGNYRAKTELDLNTTGNIVIDGDAEKHFNRRGQRILAAVDRIALEQGCAPATIAVAWLLSKPHVVATVAGVSTPVQVADLVAAAHVQLTRQQVASLDAISA